MHCLCAGVSVNECISLFGARVRACVLACVCVFVYVSVSVRARVSVYFACSLQLCSSYLLAWFVEAGWADTIVLEGKHHRGYKIKTNNVETNRFSLVVCFQECINTNKNINLG